MCNKKKTEFEGITYLDIGLRVRSSDLSFAIASCNSKIMQRVNISEHTMKIFIKYVTFLFTENALYMRYCDVLKVFNHTISVYTSY